jgi:hypothetical protein
MTTALRVGRFLTQRMSDLGAPCIWVVTDGVVRIPTCEGYDALPIELSR